MHGLSKIGIDDHRVRRVASRAGVHMRGTFAIESKTSDRFAGANVDSHVACNFGHARTDLSTAAERMEDTMFVFEKRQNRKQTRAFER